MMDPLQSNLSEKDRNKLIETYGKDSKFKNLFKNIFGGGTTKKVDNFLRENQEGINFKQEIPGYIDPRTGKVTREDQIAGLPFPYNPAGLPDDLYQATQRQYGKTDVFGPYTADDARLIRQFFDNRKGLGWAMFSKQYRERYKDALKLQRWPLVDTRKMEKEKKEKARQARLRRLYGLKDDEQLKA